jgi:hypothetical protein
MAREIHGMVNVVTDGFIWIELYVLSDMVDFCDDRGIYEIDSYRVPVVNRGIYEVMNGYLWSHRDR